MRVVAAAGFASSLLVVVAVPSLAVAQTSASFRLTTSTFNGGGDPGNNGCAASASYRITIDALGGPSAAQAAASLSFHTATGFVDGLAPPGEVEGVAFTDKITLTWNPERSVGTYQVYRDSLGSLPGDDGECFASGSSSEGAVDADAPQAGDGWFYLVTAKNSLGEEGTKGAGAGRRRARESLAVPVGTTRSTYGAGKCVSQTGGSPRTARMAKSSGKPGKSSWYWTSNWPLWKSTPHQKL
jgi:hypothetical protein